MAIVAELSGKLEGYKTAAGARYVDAEDPLTASIFESIEVMDRSLVLGTVLRQATGDEFTADELGGAKFHYWIRDIDAFGDRTEPDVIITVGDTLYLFEAKYRSGLGQETEDTPGQLKRELKGGTALTAKWGLSRFRLVCVVGDLSSQDEISALVEETRGRIHTLLWQDIHRIMAGIVESADIEPRDRILAERCKALLERRKMASFAGFRHIDEYRKGEVLYHEVFSFATTALARLEPEGIVRAVEEFRIERDGGERALAVGGVEGWATSYFALPVQTQGDRKVEKRTARGVRARFYKVERFAFFMVDVASGQVVVGRATAPADTEKEPRFWHDFFGRFKKSWDEEKEQITAIKIGDTEFGLELKALDAKAPDVLEWALATVVGYLS